MSNITLAYQVHMYNHDYSINNDLADSFWTKISRLKMKIKMANWQNSEQL